MWYSCEVSFPSSFFYLSPPPNEEEVLFLRQYNISEILTLGFYFVHSLAVLIAKVVQRGKLLTTTVGSTGIDVLSDPTEECENSSFARVNFYRQSWPRGSWSLWESRVMSHMMMQKRVLFYPAWIYLI